MFLRLAVLSAILLATLHAEDWPQFLGPSRNGVYMGGDVSGSWPAGGPSTVWKRDVGQGFSAPVVAQGRLILFHRVGNRETVESIDTKTGKTVWVFVYPTN